MSKFRLLRVLAVASIVGFTVLAASAFVKNGKNQEKKPVNDSVSKIRGLELKSSDDLEDKLRIVDFKQIPPDRMLVSVNDTLYLLNAKKEIIWVSDQIVDMVAAPIVDSTGGIYGIGGDLKHFSVNSRTGEVNYFGRDVAGSHSYYTQIKPYKNDQYLVIENMQFYRDRNLCYPQCPMRNDNLYAWRGEKLLWSTEFPPNAKLQVWGDRILAVAEKKNSVMVQEISVPKQ
ncbi:MAG TPA: hypothetical protein VGW12_00280 [Pyrinomonadaceae bacterium]|nr:hypothetical protein [Pyrinomonadaceae bacterium]